MSSSISTVASFTVTGSGPSTSIAMRVSCAGSDASKAVWTNQNVRSFQETL